MQPSWKFIIHKYISMLFEKFKTHAFYVLARSFPRKTKANAFFFSEGHKSLRVNKKKKKQQHWLVELSVLVLSVHLIFWIILTILQDQTYPMSSLEDLGCFFIFSWHWYSSLQDQVLFRSWESLFSDSESRMKDNAPIYSFDGRDVLRDSAWWVPVLWLILWTLQTEGSAEHPVTFILL